MKKIFIFGSLLFLITFVSAASAAEQYVGIGATFDQPWATSACVNCSDEMNAEQKRLLEKDSESVVSFVYVLRLVCDGPAMKAGLKLDDVIIAIEDTILAGLTQNEFREATKLITMGAKDDPVMLTIKREHESAPDELFYVGVVREIITNDHYRDYDHDCP
jgi:C-terminal processing protease CtpA/Prc